MRSPSGVLPADTQLALPADTQPALQAVDHAVWAVHRAWERGDVRAKQQLGAKPRSEYGYFQFGATHYYWAAARTRAN